MGVKLFHSTTRVLTLTEEGQAYYKRCLKALDESPAGEAYLDSSKIEVIGALRLSMPVLSGRYCVAPLLIEVAKEYPA